MIENEIQFHLAAVQGSLPLLQSFLQGPNKVSVDCTDEVSSLQIIILYLVKTV